MSLSVLAGRLNLRLVAALAVFVAVVLLTFREEVMGPALLPLRTLTARAALALIQVAGMEAVREASALYHPGGFAYEISRGCIGLVPAGVLTVAILAHPGRLRPKLVGILASLPLLVGLNLIRLVHLYYLGVYQPELFALAHKVLWQGVIVLAVFGLWLGWSVWTDSLSSGARSPRPRESAFALYRGTTGS